MTKALHTIKNAAAELAEDGENDSLKYELAVRLTAEGKEPRCCGRAIITIERCEDGDERPAGMQNWGTIKISFYPDPDATGIEHPTELYLDGGRYGFTGAQLLHPGRGSVRDRTEDLRRTHREMEVDSSHPSLPFAMRVKLAIDSADLQGLLATGTPHDEYSMISRSIGVEIAATNGVEDVLVTVRDQFTRMYGSAGIPQRHHLIDPLAHALWKILEGEKRRVSEL